MQFLYLFALSSIDLPTDIGGIFKAFRISVLKPLFMAREIEEEMMEHAEGLLASFNYQLLGLETYYFLANAFELLVAIGIIAIYVVLLKLIVLSSSSKRLTISIIKSTYRQTAQTALLLFLHLSFLPFITFATKNVKEWPD